MNIIITGSSSGVGLALCLALAKEGHQIAGISRNAKPLAILAEENNLSIVSHAADVANPEQLKTAIDKIAEGWNNHIDVLINNAAVFEKVPFEEQSLSQIERLVDTNLKGVLYATRLVLPFMLSNKSGQIVMISSVAGTRGIPGESTYCATKHGVNGFAEALAQEVIGKGVKVTTLCPGGIDTPLWNENNPYGGDKSKIMQPSEIVEAVQYVLAMPSTTFMKRMTFFPTGEWH